MLVAVGPVVPKMQDMELKDGKDKDEESDAMPGDFLYIYSNLDLGFSFQFLSVSCQISFRNPYAHLATADLCVSMF